MKITANSYTSVIPLVTAGLGIAALGTGIGLALSGSEWALVSVGTTNLAMGLSMVGASWFAAGVCIFYRFADSDKVKVEIKKKGAEQTKGLYIGYNTLQTVLAAVAYIVAAAGTYGVVHHGIARLIPAEWDIGASLGLQAGAGFFMGCIMGLIHSSINVVANGDDKGDIYKERRQHVFDIISAGLLGSAATVAGPALTHAMGVLAADSIDALVLESFIAVGIVALSVICNYTSFLLDRAGYLGTDSRVHYERVV